MSSGGIEGKWSELNDRLEETQQELTELQEQREADQSEIARLTDLLDEDVEQLAERIRVLEGEVQISVDAAFELNEEEREAMDGLHRAFEIITERWKLKANTHELVAALRVVQAFIIQHMISRQTDKWTSWWEKGASDGTGDSRKTKG